MSANNGSVSEVAAGSTAREDFGGHELTVRAETAASAVAAQATAAIQARYVMALKRPRDWDGVRVTLLKDCRRPGFAAVARYAKPVGGSKVVGPSIRFAESAIRSMGNLLPEVSTIFDDDEKRIVRVGLTDLESNVSYGKDVTIAKTVERSFLKDGQKALKTRINSSGKPVHVVAATDDDLLNKENALVSKALRGHALRLLPGDILEDCMAQVVLTLQNEDAKDPDAARKKLIDAFAALNITPANLKEYLGHEVGSSSPAEIDDLRSVYVAIKEGEATWSAAMETRQPAAEEKKAEASPAPAGEPPKTAAEIVQNAKAKKAAKGLAANSDPGPCSKAEDCRRPNGHPGLCSGKNGEISAKPEGFGDPAEKESLEREPGQEG